MTNGQIVLHYSRYRTTAYVTTHTNAWANDQRSRHAHPFIANLSVRHKLNRVS